MRMNGSESREDENEGKGREGKQGKDSETRVYCNVNECQGPAAKGNLQRTWVKSNPGIEGNEGKNLGRMRRGREEGKGGKEDRK